MRLSCKFVNMYTIAYHVQYTYTCVHMRASLMDIPERKSMRVRQKSTDLIADFIGELSGPHAPRQADCGTPRQLLRKDLCRCRSCGI